MTQVCLPPHGIAQTSVRSTVTDAWRMRRAWWFTATSRTRARFARTFFGSFWLGLSNLLSIGALALVYGTVFKVQDFSTYVVYLGVGLVVWNGISAAIGSAPNLFEHNHAHVQNTNLNPIFYVLEEWAFQVQTFLQSFALVVLALSWFQHDLLFNLVALWMVAAIEFVFVFVLGANDCLFARSAVPRLLSTCSNCASAGVFAFTNFVSQRQPWGHGLDGQPQSFLPCAQPSSSLPDGLVKFSGLWVSCCWL